MDRAPAPERRMPLAACLTLLLALLAFVPAAHAAGEPYAWFASGPPGPVGATSATFTLGLSDTATGVDCRIDGGSWTPCVSAYAPTAAYKTPPLADGVHTLTIRAHDAADVQDPNPHDWVFTTDTVPPDTAWPDAPAGTLTQPHLTIDPTSTEAPPAFQCRVDAGPWAPCGSPGMLALPNGLHTVQVRAVDEAGNPDPDPPAATFTMAAPLPDTVLAPAAAGAPGFSPSFTFSSPVGTATFECAIDRGPWTPCVAPVAFPLPGGSHTVAVRAVDDAGNRDATPATQAFIVTAPAKAPPPVSGRPTTVTVRRGTAADGRRGFALRDGGRSLRVGSGPVSRTADGLALRLACPTGGRCAGAAVLTITHANANRGLVLRRWSGTIPGGSAVLVSWHLSPGRLALITGDPSPRVQAVVALGRAGRHRAGASRFLLVR